MQTNMLDDITVIIAERPNVWVRKTISPSLWKSASPIEPWFRSFFIKYKDLDSKLYEFVENLDAMVESIHKIWDKRDTKDPNVLFDIVVRLSEANEALMGLGEVGQQIDNEYSAKMKEFHKKTPSVKISAEEPAEIRWPLATRQSAFMDSLRESWNRLPDEQRAARYNTVMALVSTVEQTAKSIKRLVEKLKKYKDVGDIGEYIETLKRISVQQQEFENEYNIVYSEYISGPEEEADAEALTERDPSLYTEPKTDPEEIEVVEEAPITEQDIAPITQRVPTGPYAEQKPGIKKMINPQTGLKEIVIAMLKLQHTRFIEELKKASSMDDPYLLAAMLAKYSEQIEEDDPESSLRLIAIAEGILEED